jgi:hypothetical protein
MTMIASTSRSGNRREIKPSSTFMQEGCVYQMGKPPFRLDVMMSMPGVTFQTVWANREAVDVEGLAIPFISKADLITAKEASGLDQDLMDAKRLRKADD